MGFLKCETQKFVERTNLCFWKICIVVLNTWKWRSINHVTIFLVTFDFPLLNYHVTSYNHNQILWLVFNQPNDLFQKTKVLVKCFFLALQKCLVAIPHYFCKINNFISSYFIFINFYLFKKLKYFKIDIIWN